MSSRWRVSVEFTFHSEANAKLGNPDEWNWPVLLAGLADDSTSVDWPTLDLEEDPASVNVPVQVVRDVPSESDPVKTYTVRLVEHRASCECKAAKFAPGKPCKHVAAVLDGDVGDWYPYALQDLIMTYPHRLAEEIEC